MILYLNSTQYIETNHFIDLSIPIGNPSNKVQAWGASLAEFTTIKTPYFIGSVQEGGSVNFRTIQFNPHGNTTHTECLGHITPQIHSINKTLNTFFFDAYLISIQPQQQSNNDWVITAEQIEQKTQNIKAKALIIRTLPNGEEKLNKNYTDSNPPYLDVACSRILDHIGVEHLLVDLPSVDKEYDGGSLAMHRAFWNVPKNPQYHKTITELVFIPNTCPDGSYLLDLQLAPFENDASPSRPILYPILE